LLKSYGVRDVTGDPYAERCAPAAKVRSADQEREALPVTSDEKRALSVARRRQR
jgi:hypothetical protein